MTPAAGGTALTVIIATRNRAEALRETLEAMRSLPRDGLQVEWVVVDNGSRDTTRQVVASFQEGMHLRYLSEPRPGKAVALNHALEQCRLGDVVVFTDDDVSPAPSWLQEIASACGRYPEVAVFGGRVIPEWPDTGVARWLTRGLVSEVCFAAHDYGREPGLYPPGRYPFGPNFWVRRSALADGARFHEEFGPRPRHRLMGGETTFLRALEAAGHRMAYWPGASVAHRVKEADVRTAAVYRRGYRFGRSRVRWYGPDGVETLRRSRLAWSGVRLASMCREVLRVLGAAALPSADRRGEARFAALVRLGRDAESLRIAWRRAPRADSPAGGPRGA